MSARTYECAHCHEVFDSTWSEEEADAEATELWGDDVHEDAAVVCDVCFHAFYEPLSAPHLAGQITPDSPVDDLIDVIVAAAMHDIEADR